MFLMTTQLWNAQNQRRDVQNIWLQEYNKSELRQGGTKNFSHKSYFPVHGPFLLKKSPPLFVARMIKTFFFCK